MRRPDGQEASVSEAGVTVSEMSPAQGPERGRGAGSCPFIPGVYLPVLTQEAYQDSLYIFLSSSFKEKKTL